MGVLLLHSHYFWGESHVSVSSLRGPLTGLPAEGPSATPRRRSWDSEAVPYLEGPAPSLWSFDEGPDSGTSSSPDCDTPDDTSNSSSVVSWGREAEGTSRSPLHASTKLPEESGASHQGPGQGPLKA